MFAGGCSSPLMILPTIVGNLRKRFISHRTLGYLLKFVQEGVKFQPFFQFGKCAKVMDKVLRKTIIKKSYLFEKSYLMDVASANPFHIKPLKFP